jgi:hypothetical protein
VAIGNLNGDGKPDLVVANLNSITVSVLLGNGDGTFGTRTDFATGSNPLSVAIGDLNGDGKSDLATASRYSNSVSVLLGNGNGTFGVKTDFATGTQPYCAAIGDLDGDGNSDLAVANYSSNTVSVLLGRGDGTFGAKTDFGTGNTPWFVAIGDLNRDGKLDLGTANGTSNSVSVLLNAGSGDPWAGVGPIAVHGEALLLAPTPNPARSATTIAFELPAAGPVTLEILDISGRLTRALSSGTEYPAGRHSLGWDGTNRTGQRVASGVYFVRFRAGEHQGMRRIVMLR